MNIAIEELYALLGAKEAELYALRRDLAAVLQREQQQKAQEEAKKASTPT